MACVRLRGRVVGGIGDFGKWIAALGDHYERKTGMRLYPGTLNVDVGVEIRLPEQRLRLEKEEYGGRVSVNIVPCVFFGLLGAAGQRAVWLRTDQNECGTGHHGLTIVEIAAEVRLRDEFGLVDGSEVEIEIP
jgi:CTP-dependent riboflavin kinase